ncbi:hypothetical protein GCM10009836_19580 [Pseudonocardia ailaonensis]|uniref:Uncharacterized protein n=1 Tax=Pseudonocardia ailaonensis TaxID=367279 RepID=A0ABN2MWC4_9PSEU
MNAQMSTGSHPDAAGVAAARARWRSAGESLFPTLVADPSTYAEAVEAIGAIAAALGRRRAGLAELAALLDDPEPLLAEEQLRVPPGVPVPLLVAVACGMRERQLISEGVCRERAAAVARARAAGADWAVLQGPDRVEDLTGGEFGGPAGCLHLHLPSGTELRATIDVWSGEPFRLDVLPSGGTPTGRSFADRETWLEGCRAARAAVDEG